MTNLHELRKLARQAAEDAHEVEEDALKPCPFCGGRSEIIEVEETDNQGGFVVCCTSCEASTRVWFPIKDDVRRILREAWNDRAIDHIADAVLLVVTQYVEQQEQEKKHHGAELIHQTIPDVGGTEPRLNNVCAAWATTRKNCPEFNAVVQASAANLQRAERAEAAIRRNHRASCVCVFCEAKPK